MSDMTREKAKQILEADGYLSYHAWTFFKYGMNCWDDHNCCQDDWKTVEEALDRIEYHCGADWSKVVEEC
jgi:hypothetical protein